MSDAVNFAELMTKLGPNLAGGRTSEPLPVGEYSLVITECTSKLTSTGKNMLSLKAVVDGGPHNNRPVWDNLVISPDNETAMRIFFGKMGALGLQDYLLQNPGLEELASAMLNRRFIGKLGTSEYRGKTRNEITAYKPYLAATAAPAAADIPAVLDAQTFPVASPAPVGAAVPPPPAAPAVASIPPAPAF
jgi:hypothetical protein